MTNNMYSSLEFGEDVLYADLEFISGDYLRLLMYVNDNHDDVFKLNALNCIKLAQQLETLASPQFIERYFRKDFGWTTINYHTPDDKCTAIKFENRHKRPFELSAYPYIDQDTGEPKYYIELANCDWKHVDTNVFFDQYSWLRLKCSFTEIKAFSEMLKSFPSYFRLVGCFVELHQEMKTIENKLDAFIEALVQPADSSPKENQNADPQPNNNNND